MKMLSVIIIELTLAVMLTFTITPLQAEDNPANSPLCAGLTHKAKGLCTAAVAVGCDIFETSRTTPCKILSGQYKQETGQQSPWEPTCPCYTIQSINALIISPNCPPTECNDDFDPNANFYTVTEMLDENGTCYKFSQVGVWTLEGYPSECHISGIGGTATFVLNKEQAKACSYAIKASDPWKLCP